MKSTKYIKSSIVFVFIAILFFIVGFWVGNSNYQKTKVVYFYANILKNNEFIFHVEGIPENDVNHRGEFFVGLDNLETPNTAFDAYGNKVSISDLKTGQIIRIEYDGIGMEVSPVIIENVYNIYIID